MTFLLSLKSGSFTVPFRRIHSWVIFVLKSCVTVAKYLSMEKWIKKMWYIYSAMRKKEILPFVNNIDEPWGHYAKWNKSDKERQIVYDLTYTWDWKNTWTQRNRVEWWLPGVKGEKNEMLVIGYKLSTVRWISLRDLMQSMVTTVNDIALYTWNLLRE